MFLRRQHPDAPADRPDEGSRSVPSRRVRHRLPSNRAVVGGILITVAAGGVLIAHREASVPPSTRYVVLTGDVAAGETIGADDLGTIALEIPGDLQVVAGDQVERLVGRTARVGLSELDLLRPDDLLDAGRFTDPATVEIAIALSPARALAGSVAVGSVVDVLSTDPAGTGTSTVTSSALITGLDAPDSAGIGSDGVVVVRLAVADSTAAEVVTDAAVRTDVTLALPAPTSEDPT